MLVRLLDLAVGQFWLAYLHHSFIALSLSYFNSSANILFDVPIDIVSDIKNRINAKRNQFLSLSPPLPVVY